MACHFPLLHSCGTHEKSAMDCSRTQVEREMKAMTPVEATRRCAGEKGCPDICPLLHRARKSTGRSSSSTGKSAIIEGEGWQGERRSGLNSSPQTSVDPLGTYPTKRSITRRAREVSGHQIACHFL